MSGAVRPETRYPAWARVGSVRARPYRQGRQALTHRGRLVFLVTLQPAGAGITLIGELVATGSGPPGIDAAMHSSEANARDSSSCR